MRVLVTGACGFVGRHLLAELAARGHTIVGMDKGPAPSDLPVQEFLPVDITHADAVKTAVRRLAPDACIHLAAIAFVPSGKLCPRTMTEVNVMGTVNLLEALRTDSPSTRLLFVSTAQVYGTSARPSPAREDDALQPESLYGITKTAADSISLLYARQYGMPVMVARPYNHIGPGQAPDYVVASFARQITAIRQGGPPVIRVGNLASRRDFTDVRDIVRAYGLLLEKGVPGKAYNIASGQQVHIGEILTLLSELAGVQPQIVRDESLFRPDDNCLELDITQLHETTGWAPVIPLRQTLADIVNFP
jgi:GDP-4-dehydro-6-deoxy-D-mannose reductase